MCRNASINFKKHFIKPWKRFSLQKCRVPYTKRQTGVPFFLSFRKFCPFITQVLPSGHPSNLSAVCVECLRSRRSVFLSDRFESWTACPVRAAETCVTCTPPFFYTEHNSGGTRPFPWQWTGSREHHRHRGSAVNASCSHTGEPPPLWAGQELASDL